jgi:diguanylate cyclase
MAESTMQSGLAPDQPQGIASQGPPPAGGANLVFSLGLAVLGAVLLAEFFVAYSLLVAHPEHSPGMAWRAYAGVVLGFLALTAQAVAVYSGLLRPLRMQSFELLQLRMILDQHSHHDPLTLLLNRTAFDQMIVRALDGLRRYGAGFSAIMLDVDGFRAVNQAKGYEAGDHVLAELARLLKEHIRKSDSIFRWRSGRFLVLAPGIGAVQAKALADKLGRLTAEHGFQDGVRLTLTMGVCQAQADDSPELFVARIKTCLAQAKERGRAESALSCEAP